MLKSNNNNNNNNIFNQCSYLFFLKYCFYLWWLCKSDSGFKSYPELQPSLCESDGTTISDPLDFSVSVGTKVFAYFWSPFSKCPQRVKISLQLQKNWKNLQANYWIRMLANITAHVVVQRTWVFFQSGWCQGIKGVFIISLPASQKHCSTCCAVTPHPEFAS